MSAPLSGLDELEGVVRASKPQTIMMLEAAYVLQMIERLHHAEELAAAAIRLAWSESGTKAALQDGPAHAALYEPWDEMTALVDAIDPMRPGWRAKGNAHA